MKSKTSFFSPTIFKKDLTRFLPLWAIYLIVGLLLCVTSIGYSDWADAEEFAFSLEWMAAAMCIYALISTQLLFGDLFQGRLCNAIHALPVRREGLFFTHYAAGMVMGVMPNLLIALVAMFSMGKFWFVALLWCLATVLMYFLFFNIGVFAIFNAGNRLGAVGIYALVNFFAMLAMWYFEVIYLPMLYGLVMTDSIREYFHWFSPAVHMVNCDNWLKIVHDPTCACHLSDYALHYTVCKYTFKGFGDGWLYLGLLSAISVAIAGASLLLYRRRHMESAGDFVAFKPMGVVFTLIASAGVGALLYIVAEESYIGLFIGLILGFFLCKMLLDRTIKVFYKVSFLQLGAFLLVIALTLGMTYFDVAGVESRIPDVEDVKSVTIADSYLAEWRLESISMEQPQEANRSVAVDVAVDPFYAYAKDGQLTLTKPEDIEQIRQIHQLLLEEGDASKNNMFNFKTVTLHYVLKNGKTVTRYYYTMPDSPAMQRLARYTGTPLFILGFDDAQTMVDRLCDITVYVGEKSIHMTNVSHPEFLEKLVYALFADAEAGFLSTNDKTNFEIELMLSMENDNTRIMYLPIPSTAEHTHAWLEEYQATLEPPKV